MHRLNDQRVARVFPGNCSTGFENPEHEYYVTVQMNRLCKIDML